MSIWLCRAGRFGEHEARFLENNKIYFTFEEIDKPLNSFSGRAAIQQYFLEKVPTLKERAALNFASQAHIFSSRMSVDDWVISISEKSWANMPLIQRLRTATATPALLSGSLTFRKAFLSRIFNTLSALLLPPAK